MKKSYSSFLFIVLSISLSGQSSRGKDNAQSDGKAVGIVYNIKDYGAVNSTKSNSTIAIQKAIDECNLMGGGTVYVPAGSYLIGTIQLKSNVNLHLSRGAILFASKEIKDYPAIKGASHGAFAKELGVQSSVYSLNSSNVSITGEGEIMLNGGSFVNTSAKPTFDFEPDSLQKTQGTIIMGKRPSHSLYFQGCTNLSFRDFKISDSPAFTLSLGDCSIIEISNIFIDNNMRLPNNDGIHLSGCRNAVVADCKIFAGDDCVAITCLGDYSKTSENIIITNSVFSSFSAGVRVGFLGSRIKNVVLSNLIITESNRGIILGTGTGGNVSNVSIQNCIINAQIKVGRWWGNGEPIVIFIDDKVNSDGNYLGMASSSPVIENITVSHIQSVSENGVHIIGNKGNIDKILFYDCNFTIVDSHNRKVAGGFYDIQPGGFRNREKSTIASVYASGVNNLSFDNVFIVNKLVKQKDFVIVDQLVNSSIIKKEIEYLPQTASVGK